MACDIFFHLNKPANAINNVTKKKKLIYKHQIVWMRKLVKESGWFEKKKTKKEKQEQISRYIRT